MLAIFRAGDDAAEACRAALAAIEAVIAHVDADRAAAAEDRRFGIKTALHFGEVAYGNIGSGARLDYTVIGSGVNVASRIADLAGQLDQRVCASADFARLLPDRAFDSVGRHRLRGVPAPQEVFRLEGYALAADE